MKPLVCLLPPGSIDRITYNTNRTRAESNVAAMRLAQRLSGQSLKVRGSGCSCEDLVQSYGVAYTCKNRSR